MMGVLRALDRRLLTGVLFMCGSGLVFPVMNGAAKLLGANYNSVQISWARAFGHVLFLMMAFLPKYGVAFLKTKRPMLQAFRSSMLFLSNLCFFFAISFIPIAQASSISMTGPLVVALLAWPMLGERTTKARLVLLAVGFAGVLIVIRPGSALFHWASLLVVANSTFYGVYQILTRRVSTVDSPATSAFYSSTVGAFVMIAAMPFVWKTPVSGFDLTLFCAMGVLGAAGHYCVARALQLAPANLVSPFQYFQLIGSVLVGYLVFGDLPDGWTWFGAGVIVAAGLALGWTQTRRQHEQR
jgi:drug/metabolite transporter (DMT)-like permease